MLVRWVAKTRRRATCASLVTNLGQHQQQAGRGKRLTVSGVSFGWTRWPSKRKRTELTVLPWRSQKAPMSFSSLVDFFILKKTSLLLSVTLMFRCSVCAGASGRSAAGEPFSCWSDDIAAVAGVEDELVDEDRDERVDDQGTELNEPFVEEVSVHRDDRHEDVTHDGVL